MSGPSSRPGSTTDLREGMHAGLAVVPSFLAIFAGFGIASQVADMPGWAALALTVFVYAGPAQFAVAELGAQSPALVLQMIVASTIINLRFVVMSMSLTQLFPRLSTGRVLLVAHLVSASSYLLTFFRSRREPGANLYAYYLGISVVAFPAAVLGTLIGLAFGADLPLALTFGATLFLPTYFGLLLASEVRGRREIAAVGAGLVLTPPAELLVPGWGMFLTALAAGAALAASER